MVNDTSLCGANTCILSSEPAVVSSVTTKPEPSQHPLVPKHCHGHLVHTAGELGEGGVEETQLCPKGEGVPEKRRL